MMILLSLITNQREVLVIQTPTMMVPMELSQMREFQELPQMRELKVLTSLLMVKVDEGPHEDVTLLKG
jgi:hypothetical protein